MDRASHRCGVDGRAVTAAQKPPEASPAAQQSLALPSERHLRNVRQLTFGGENAEAYFSFDGLALVSVDARGHECDHIFVMHTDGSERADDQYGQGSHDVLVLSTRRSPRSVCVDASRRRGLSAEAGLLRGYVWAVYKDYDIFVTDPKTGSL